MDWVSSDQTAELRLAALRATELLDSPADERFDRLTRLAQTMLRTPVALVSLLDADRQFFLSTRGMPEPWASLRETPLSYSLCRSIVETGLPLVISDARADPRTSDHPAVQILGVIAYFGVPLSLPDGCVVGALCVVDTVPRTWLQSEQSALADLAAAVMSEFAAGLRLLKLREAERALRASEARSRALIDALGVAVYTTDVEGRLTYYNEAAARLWGWRPPLRETRWFGSWRLYWPDGKPMPSEECPMRLTLRDEKPPPCEEVLAERPDGGRVSYIPYPTLLRDQANTVVGGLNVLVDITQRKAAEAALTESEARLRSILQTIPDALLLIDERGSVQSFSPTAEQLFGCMSGEAIGRHVFEFIAHADGVDGSEPFAGSQESDPITLGAGVPVVGRRKDGSIFPAEIALGEVTVNERRLYTGLVRDVTERLATQSRLQALQDELLHVSRLSAAGEMASALAHELNQPMTAVASAVRAAKRMMSVRPEDRIPRADVQAALALAAEQVLRAGDIVRGLRQFIVRDGAVERRPERLAGLAEEARTLALIGAKDRGIQARFCLSADLPSVLVDRVQIQQVLLNLIRNAIEAMTQEPADLGARTRRELTIGALAAGSGMVEVSVRDTGPGLSPAVAGRLFESFVSTKRGGMGVGLSISRTIIEAHGGRIWSENRPDGGAVFRFTLPAA